MARYPMSRHGVGGQRRQLFRPQAVRRTAATSPASAVALASPAGVTQRMGVGSEQETVGHSIPADGLTLDRHPHRATDSLWFPIVQELVTEGKLTGAGSAYHAWGDEWNMVLGYSAASHTAFLSAFCRDGESPRSATPDVHQPDPDIVFGAQGTHVQHGEGHDARARCPASTTVALATRRAYHAPTANMPSHALSGETRDD